MRTIIAGGRDCENESVLEDALNECGWVPTVVLCGMARGADTLGMLWAERNEVPVEKYPAEWKKHGKIAGPIRNGEMANTGDALIALWDGKSRGTRDMIAKARLKGLKIHIQRY